MFQQNIWIFIRTASTYCTGKENYYRARVEFVSRVAVRGGSFSFRSFVRVQREMQIIEGIFLLSGRGDEDAVRHAGYRPDYERAHKIYLPVLHIKWHWNAAGKNETGARINETVEIFTSARFSHLGFINFMAVLRYTSVSISRSIIKRARSRRIMQFRNLLLHIFFINKNAKFIRNKLLVLTAEHLAKSWYFISYMVSIGILVASKRGWMAWLI